MISRLLEFLGLKLKPINVPSGLYDYLAWSSNQRASVRSSAAHRALDRARARWGEADLMVSLPDGRYRLVG